MVVIFSGIRLPTISMRLSVLIYYHIMRLIVRVAGRGSRRDQNKSSPHGCWRSVFKNDRPFRVVKIIVYDVRFSRPVWAPSRHGKTRSVGVPMNNNTTDGDQFGFGDGTPLLGARILVFSSARAVIIDFSVATAVGRCYQSTSSAATAP